MKIVSAAFLRAAVNVKDYPPGRLREVAFAGRSNVGKSSMINTLLGRHNLVKTSKTPGHTRKLNFFLINDDFFFVDFPGYGFAKAPLKVRESWPGLIDTYLSEREQLAGVVAIVDARHFPTDSDVQLLQYLQGKQIPVIIAATKADKLNNSQIASLPSRIRNVVGDLIPIIAFSSLTGLGKIDLWREIKNLMR
jgi:GTP-binding protein